MAAKRVDTPELPLLDWDELFLYTSCLAGLRSKDPSTQVGACCVDHDNRILSIGYNGFPRGCGDDELPWSRDGASALDTKYLYVVHAEVNAVLNCAMCGPRRANRAPRESRRRRRRRRKRALHAPT